MGLAHHLEEDKHVRGGKPYMSTADMVSFLIKYMKSGAPRTPARKSAVKVKGGGMKQADIKKYLEEDLPAENVAKFLEDYKNEKGWRKG